LYASAAAAARYASTHSAAPAPQLRDAQLPKHFPFRELEPQLYRWWESSGLFKPDESSLHSHKPYVIPMPPPNVTGFLHMGHALMLALQDILARFHRMRGRPTLWLPGTDHAGIATQLQVEKALAKEGLKRTDLTRKQFLERVWQWKDEKGDYIVQQMRRMGTSADWSRLQFTLNGPMSEAVTEAFVRLYEKGLIYKGNYLVNWSPNLQTAISDLEVDYVEEPGKLYIFKYMLEGHSGEYIPVATTRPETILGDTAVCVHPDDQRYTHFIGKRVIVPTQARTVPVIADPTVDMKFGTGALKVTPAHDPVDYELAKKHRLPSINIMTKSATINENGGVYEGLDRFVCRSKIWQDMEAQGLALRVEDHMQRVPRSQRGGEVVEPMLSDQWFLKMDGMSKAALAAVGSGKIRILPERFEKVTLFRASSILLLTIRNQLTPTNLRCGGRCTTDGWKT
jgi:valyl-tRNA synthetase